MFIFDTTNWKVTNDPLNGENTTRVLLNCAVDNDNNIYFLSGYNLTSNPVLPLGPYLIRHNFDVLHTTSNPLSYQQPITDFPSIADYSATYVNSIHSIIYIGGRDENGIFADITKVRVIINHGSSFNIN